MKEIDRFTREMSVKLPVMYYIHIQTFKVTREDIKNYGLGICGYEYLLDVLIKREVNHKRRMKRAYVSNGIKGMKKYVNNLFE